jgi:hypothetical protein
VAPPVIETGQRHWIPLEDIRYELVTEVFVRSGEAREWCAADDPDLTIATLGRSVWLGLWEHALTAVSQRASQAINARLEAAAAESRCPPVAPPVASRSRRGLCAPLTTRRRERPLPRSG